MKMETNKRLNMFLPFVLFIVIGALFAGGSPEPIKPKSMHIECQDYTKDDDSQGGLGFISDQDCQDYPYNDGNGETLSGTMGGVWGNEEPPYQIYFDLSVDFVRVFVEIECSNNLANCAGTNFNNEVQFFCWFGSNIMSNDFYSIYDRAFNQVQSITDDGSIQSYNNACTALTPPTTLPDMGTSTTSPIPTNSGGSGGGSGGK
jgi:hypothetical protein